MGMHPNAFAEYMKRFKIPQMDTDSIPIICVLSPNIRVNPWFQYKKKRNKLCRR